MVFAGAAAGLAVIGGWVTNPVARVVVIIVAVALGACLFDMTQPPSGELLRPRDQHPELGESPDREALPSVPVRPLMVTRDPAGDDERRLLAPVLKAATTMPVWFRDVRKQRARRKVRLRPDMLPPRLTTFRGRAHDLNWLRSRHDELDRRNRRRRCKARVQQVLREQLSSTDGPLGRPLMLFLYGSPGVGKTALAQELAHKLRSSYPDGQLYVNLGVAGGPRTPRDILRVFLRELGWPEDELREAVKLGNAFRAATTKRRLLVVLDAARDAHQIEAVLPGGDRCAVIVTSRANLAGTEHGAWRVDTPSPAEAASIMSAYLTTDADLPGDIEIPSAELIAEAAELCGRQPIALRAIGEKARHTSGGLRDIVSGLRNPQARLHRLAYGGRDAGERIATEYDLLGQRLQLALQVLALVEASNFTPWVLQPLLGTRLPESANLMAALSEVGLLNEFQNDPTGFPRYEFGALVRLFAEHELRNTRASDEAPLIRAQGNFRLGLVMLAMQVTAELDPDADLGIPPEIPEDWVPIIDDWKHRVARHARFWIRAEFPNLVEAAREAYDRSLYTLTWKLCAQLTDCDVAHPFTDAVRDAFEKARDAAGSADDPQALALVLLAEGSCLLAGERYTNAVATFAEALQEAQGPGDYLIRARACRLIGQAEQRLGTYAAAADHLRTAQDALRLAAPADELAREAGIIAALLAENHFHTNPDHRAKTGSHGLDMPPANASFIEHLTAARVARHRNDLAACRAALQKAADAIDGDDRLAFQLQLERISCSLKCLQTQADQADVIADAAHLVVTSAAADATMSSAEARILLAEALLARGDSAHCLSTLSALTLPHVAAGSADRWPRLHAQRLRLQGEAQFISGDLAEAEQSTRFAAEQFAEMKDFWGQADAQLLLGAIQLTARRRSAALISLLTALENFQRCGDNLNAERALALLAHPALLLAGRTITVQIKRWRQRLPAHGRLRPPQGLGHQRHRPDHPR